MKNVYIYILLMSLTTYLIRVLPLLLIKKEITNHFVKSFLYYIPYACLACMTFPSIVLATENIISGVLAFGVACLFAYKEKSIVEVAIITCAIVFISDLLLAIV